MSGPRPRVRVERGSAPPERPATVEERAALALVVTLHAALVVALAIAAMTLAKYWSALDLPTWQKVAFEAGIGAALITFALRGARHLRRLLRRPS